MIWSKTNWSYTFLEWISWQISSNWLFQWYVGSDLERVQTSEHCFSNFKLVAASYFFLSSGGRRSNPMNATWSGLYIYFLLSECAPFWSQDGWLGGRRARVASVLGLLRHLAVPPQWSLPASPPRLTGPGGTRTSPSASRSRTVWTKTWYSTAYSWQLKYPFFSLQSSPVKAESISWNVCVCVSVFSPQKYWSFNRPHTVYKSSLSEGCPESWE